MTKILLLQNNADDLSELGEILKKNEYIGQFTLSVRKAIELLESDPLIDLIIAEISIPARAGLDLLRYVRRNQKFQYIPFVITSDGLDQENILKYVRLGVNEIITRPFEEVVFIAKIEKSLSNGKRAVLIVDDEKEILDLLKHLIELERFKVHTALDAEQALDLLKENMVHAVVSDIILPGMSGFELMAAIKEKKKNLPVILITGHGGEFTPERALEAGADGYFIKPFRNVDLTRKLRQVIQAKPIRP